MAEDKQNIDKQKQIIQSEFICKHFLTQTNNANNGKILTSDCRVGDAHLMNCNHCGSFFPKSGSLTLRSTVRISKQCKLFSSDILRNMYSQCQLRHQKQDQVLKLSNQYCEVRSLIIDWLCEVTENLRLSQRSLYHAISIMDTFLSIQLKESGKDMDQNLIMLQGLACLFISAKNYEMDPTVPSSRKFLRQLPGYKPTQKEQKIDNEIYQFGISSLQGQQTQDLQSSKFNSCKNELCEQEQYILNLIGFEFDTYPLFYDIVEIFMTQGLLFSSDSQVQDGQTRSVMVDQSKQIVLLEKYIDFFQLLSLQDHKLVNTNQYLIACSVASAARQHCHLNPVWTQELVQLTGLQQIHFGNIEKRIILKFDQQYNNLASSQMNQNPVLTESTNDTDLQKEKLDQQKFDYKQSQPNKNQIPQSVKSPKQFSQQVQSEPSQKNNFQSENSKKESERNQIEREGPKAFSETYQKIQNDHANLSQNQKMTQQQLDQIKYRQTLSSLYAKEARNNSQSNNIENKQRNADNEYLSRINSNSQNNDIRVPYNTKVSLGRLDSQEAQQKSLLQNNFEVKSYSVNIQPLRQISKDHRENNQFINQQQIQIKNQQEMEQQKEQLIKQIKERQMQESMISSVQKNTNLSNQKTIEYQKQQHQIQMPQQTLQPVFHNAYQQINAQQNQQQQKQQNLTQDILSYQEQLKNQVSQKHQKSQVFQKMIQNQKKKYEEREIEEQKERLEIAELERQKLKGRIITQEDQQSKQMELRIKYGSNANKNRQLQQNMQQSLFNNNLSQSRLLTTSNLQSSGIQHQQIINKQLQSSNSSIIKGNNSAVKVQQAHQNQYSTRNGRNSSQSTNIQSNHFNRQKSSVSVTSAPGGGVAGRRDSNINDNSSTGRYNQHQNSAGVSNSLFNNRLMSGTMSSNIRKEQVRQDTSGKRVSGGLKQSTAIYSRQMSNIRNQLQGVGALNGGSISSKVSITPGVNSGRAVSVNSTSSIEHRSSNIAAKNQLNTLLQNSEAKSMVRAAMKLQKRGEKILINQRILSDHGFQSNSSKGFDAQQNNVPVNSRSRVNSGVPFLRAVKYD